MRWSRAFLVPASLMHGCSGCPETSYGLPGDDVTADQDARRTQPRPGRETRPCGPGRGSGVLGAGSFFASRRCRCRVSAAAGHGLGPMLAARVCSGRRDERAAAAGGRSGRSAAGHGGGRGGGMPSGTPTGGTWRSPAGAAASALTWPVAASMSPAARCALAPLGLRHHHRPDGPGTAGDLRHGAWPGLRVPDAHRGAAAGAGAGDRARRRALPRRLSPVARCGARGRGGGRTVAGRRLSCGRRQVPGQAR